jgi:predicted dehydrogenase
MMGQEHVSYILKYQDSLSLDFLCDPNRSSIDNALAIINNSSSDAANPRILMDEKELLQHIDEIDLLVIASPNFMHTPQLLRWSQYDITILVEKPVAISEKQVAALKAACLPGCKANIWVAMEYRFIPAINKLIQKPVISKKSRYARTDIHFSPRLVNGTRTLKSQVIL